MMSTFDQSTIEGFWAFADNRSLFEETAEIFSNFSELKIQILPYFNEVLVVSATLVSNFFFGQNSWT